MKINTTFFKNTLLAGLIVTTGCASPSLNSSSNSFEQLVQNEVSTTESGQNVVQVFEQSNPLRQNSIQQTAATEELPKKKGLPPFAKYLGGFFGGSKQQDQPTETNSTAKQPEYDTAQSPKIEMSSIPDDASEFGQGTLVPTVTAAAKVTPYKTANSIQGNPAIQPSPETQQAVAPQSKVIAITPVNNPVLKVETETASPKKKEPVLSGFISKLKNITVEKISKPAQTLTPENPVIVEQALPIVKSSPRISVAQNTNSSATRETILNKNEPESQSRASDLWDNKVPVEKIPSEKEWAQLTENVYQINPSTDQNSQAKQQDPLSSALDQVLKNHSSQTPSKVVEVSTPQEVPQITEAKTVEIASPIAVTPRFQVPEKSFKPTQLGQSAIQSKVVIPYYNPLRDTPDSSAEEPTLQKEEARVVENRPPMKSTKTFLNNLRAEQTIATQDRIEAERKQADLARIEQEKIDLAIAEKSKQENEKLELARREQERLELVKVEQAKIDQERVEFEKAEQTKAALARLKKEQSELARIEKEKKEQVQIEEERLELARSEKTKNDRLRLLQQQVHSNDSIVSRLKQSRQLLSENGAADVKSLPQVALPTPTVSKVTTNDQGKGIVTTSKAPASKLPVILPAFVSSELPLKTTDPKTKFTPVQIVNPQPSVNAPAPSKAPGLAVGQSRKLKPLVISNPAQQNQKPAAIADRPIVIREPTRKPENLVRNKTPEAVVEIFSTPKSIEIVNEPIPVKVATKPAGKTLPRFPSFWSSSKAKPIPKEVPKIASLPSKASVTVKPEVEVANRPLPPVMTVEEYLKQNKKTQSGGQSGTSVYVIGSD